MGFLMGDDKLVDLNKKDINSRIDENLLTGCLTIYNIHLKKVKFNIQVQNVKTH